MPSQFNNHGASSHQPVGSESGYGRLSTGHVSKVKVEKPKRARKTYSYEPCRKLKIKCNRGTPCAHCSKQEKKHAKCIYLNVVAKGRKRDAVRQKSTSNTISEVNGSDEPSEDEHQEEGEDLEQGLDQNSEHVASSLLDQPQQVEPAAPTTPPLPPTSHFYTDSNTGHMDYSGVTASFAPSQPFDQQPDVVPLAQRQSHPHPVSIDVEEDDMLAKGTLTIGEDGRARFIGPTAGSEWLREPDDSELPTPFPGAAKGADQPAFRGFGTSTRSKPEIGPFMMAPALALSAWEQAWSSIPDEDDAQIFIDCYYRHLAWNYNIIPRSAFNKDRDDIYFNKRNGTRQVHPHSLACFFAILASGAQLNLELPWNDPIGKQYIEIAQQCLVFGNYLVKNTLRAVQSLHIMGHFYLSSDPRAESAWPLWGIAMRMIQAMGLHRDGSNWGLRVDVVEERRRVFHECITADIFQSHCFSRPSVFHPDHYDTLYPIDDDGLAGVDGFKTLKFKLARLSNSILHQVMKVHPPSYAVVQELGKDVLAFDSQIPFHLRCRPAMLALIDLSRTQEDVINTTPEIRKGEFRLTFQQHTMALNVAENVMFLHRPYYAKALCQSGGNPLASKYAASLVAVFERCLSIIAIARSLYLLYPAVMDRHWSTWYHCFSASVCLSSLVSLSPTCILAPFAMGELDSVVQIMSSAPPGSRPRGLLGSLLKLKKTAESRLKAQGQNGSNDADMAIQMAEMFGFGISAPSSFSGDDEAGEEDEDQLALLGRTTRLVRRLKTGFHERGVSVPSIQGHQIQISPVNDDLITASTVRSTGSGQWVEGSHGLSMNLIQRPQDFMFDFDTFPNVAAQGVTESQLQPDLELLAGWGVQAGWFNPSSS